ncbi:MAG: hypothetical protein FWH03_05485 [Firmicutes bacterium]|nr:hypothetical protein [Bacillota bacterium]
MIEQQIPYRDVILVFEEDAKIQQLVRWYAYHNDGSKKFPKKGELIDDGTTQCDTDGVLHITNELLRNTYKKIYAI